MSNLIGKLNFMEDKMLENMSKDTAWGVLCVVVAVFIGGLLKGFSLAYMLTGIVCVAGMLAIFYVGCIIYNTLRGGDKE